MVGIAATHAATVGGKTTIVLPGAGINEKNAAALVAATGVTEVHGSFRSPHPCATTYKRQGVFMGACMCVRVCACVHVRACVRACVFAGVFAGVFAFMILLHHIEY